MLHTVRISKHILNEIQLRKRPIFYLMFFLYSGLKMNVPQTYKSFKNDSNC